MHVGVICLCLGMMSAAGDAAFLVGGKAVAHDPPPKIEGDIAFISPDVFAGAIGLTAKTVAAGKLMILCSDVSCLPVHLTAADVRPVGDRVFVDARRLAIAAGYSAQIEGDDVKITRNKKAGQNVDFELAPDSMLPDVVLTDMDGREVHLADFLGRRVLICTWASW